MLGGEPSMRRSLLTAASAPPVLSSIVGQYPTQQGSINSKIFISRKFGANRTGTVSTIKLFLDSPASAIVKFFTATYASPNFTIQTVESSSPSMGSIGLNTFEGLNLPITTGHYLGIWVNATSVYLGTDLGSNGDLFYGGSGATPVAGNTYFLPSTSGRNPLLEGLGY